MTILNMIIGIISAWFVGMIAATFGICIVLVIYSSVKKISADKLWETLDFGALLKTTSIIGMIFAAIAFIVSGGKL